MTRKQAAQLDSLVLFRHPATRPNVYRAFPTHRGWGVNIAYGDARREKHLVCLSHKDYADGRERFEEASCGNSLSL